MVKMKNNAIVGNTRHCDNEIDMAGLEKVAEKVNIKPQLDCFVFPGGQGILILAKERLLNLRCATGHPSFVTSFTFTVQALAQIKLWTEKNWASTPPGRCACCPRGARQEGGAAPPQEPGGLLGCRIKLLVGVGPLPRGRVCHGGRCW